MKRPKYKPLYLKARTYGLAMQNELLAAKDLLRTYEQALAAFGDGVAENMRVMRPPYRLTRAEWVALWRLMETCALSVGLGDPLRRYQLPDMLQWRGAPIALLEDATQGGGQ